MSWLKKIDYRIPMCHQFVFPLMASVEQSFPQEKVEDITDALRAEFTKVRMMDFNGKRIAITAGSRGIPNIARIIFALGEFLKSKGAEPFVIPAMGSHGNASSLGQVEVLENLGVTEKNVKMKIESSLDTVCLGHVRGKIPVYFDKYALEADGIVVCNRIKPHTDFRADIESGLCKMLAIGLGNHKGACAIHKEGMQNFPWLLPEIAELCIARTPILFALGIVDNAYHNTARITILKKNEIISAEPKLLEIAKKNMAKIFFDDIDVLVVDEIGKDISGAGMDPNVIGRTVLNVKGFDFIKINRIVVLGLSKATKGHATGLSMADITTRKVANAIDYGKVYTNSIAVASPEGAKLPMVLNNERDAIMFAILCSKRTSPEETRLVRIKNTMELKEIQVSESILGEVKRNNKIKLISDLAPLTFSDEGDE